SPRTSSTPPELPRDVELSGETPAFSGDSLTARRAPGRIRPAWFRHAPDGGRKRPPGWPRRTTSERKRAPACASAAGAIAAVEPARFLGRNHLEHGDHARHAWHATRDARRFLRLGRGDEAHEVDGRLLGHDLDGVARD